MGVAARRRAEADFAYDALAARLTPLAGGDLSVLSPIAPVTFGCSQQQKVTREGGPDALDTAP